LTDDEEHIHSLFHGQGEKVKTNFKPSPQPSDESEVDSSNDFSDEEANQFVHEMNEQSRDFMARLIVELEKSQDTIISERSEREALRLEVNQVESVIATLKEDLAATQAQCNSLKLRNEELEEQYSLLWSSTSHILRR
jgi:chromosome segregation ATPase